MSTRTPEITTVVKTAPAAAKTTAPAVTPRVEISQFVTMSDNLLYSIDSDKVLTIRIDTRRTLYDTEKSHIVSTSHGCALIESLGLKLNLTLFEAK